MSIAGKQRLRDESMKFAQSQRQPGPGRHASTRSATRLLVVRRRTSATRPKWPRTDAMSSLAREKTSSMRLSSAVVRRPRTVVRQPRSIVL